LQDEETPINNKKFNGDVTPENQDRTMDEIITSYFKANPSCIDSLFTGIVRNTVKCASCDHESITYKPFSALSLDLESKIEKSLKLHFDVH